MEQEKNTRQVTVMFPESLYKQVELAAAAEKLAVGSIIRRAVFRDLFEREAKTA